MTSMDDRTPDSVSGRSGALGAESMEKDTTRPAFLARVNTFNASTGGPFGSFLRIHNNGSTAGSVTISVLDDATGEPRGTAFNHPVAVGATTQLSSLQIEEFAAIPPASRNGAYTVCVTGPIIGYVQHILFDPSRMSPTSLEASKRPEGATTESARVGEGE